MVRKPTASADRERFLALASADGAYSRTREDRVDVHLLGVYRMFASWIDSGEQAGAHLRGETGVRSTRFRGVHNWISLETIDWDALPSLIAEAKTIAAKRNAGKAGPVDVYKPLAKAVAAARVKPTALHAGGPRAKVLSGERELAVAVCKACLDRLVHLGPAGEETDEIKRIAAVLDPRQGATWYPAARTLAFGTEGARRTIDDTDPVPLQMLRAAVAAANAGSQSCMPHATKALLRAVRELEATESADAACAFLVEIDELVMRSEFEAALAKYAKQAVAIDRVLWRGADAKGFPAWWLVRIDRANYGLLGKLGTRWTWNVDARDAVFATIPDEHFEAAVEIAIERDRAP